MKRILLVAGLAILFTQAFTQAVQRNQVVVEIGTGTWCQYCPGAANGAHDLLINGCQVAVIENHNGDAFANTYSNTRNSYYSVPGYPTAYFDGVSSWVGGALCPNGNVYSNYLPLYTTRYAISSPLVIDISGTNVGNDYNIVLSIKKLATVSGSDLRVHLVLTESNISTPLWPPSYLCMNSVSHVNRLMVPDAAGTPVTFTSGDFQIITLSFTKDASWVAANCELVAFVQDYPTKEIYNGSKVALNSLPLPVNVDFSGTPTTGCAPVTTNFTDLSSGMTNWQWEFQGGTPPTASAQNPSTTYNASGTNNVTLTAWSNVNNRGNKKVKTGYITVNAVPLAPTTPSGLNNLCENPSNTTYTTVAPSNATTISWDLQPPSAGTLTPGGATCSIDWNNTYIGTAQLKVRGSNVCGDGAWSPILTITISSMPAVPGNPTGPTAICQDSPNTVYTTSGSPVATGYTWDLTPSTAGTISFNMTTATVDWSSSFTGTAEIKVLANNGACQSGWSAPCVVTVSAGPLLFSMTGGGTYCGQGGTGVEIGLSGSQAGVDYTLYYDGSPTTTVVPGTGGAISFGLQTGAGDYTAQASDPVTTCTINMSGTSTVSVDPQAPNTPGDPSGPGTVYSGSNPTTDYTTSGGTYATTYAWQVSPVEAGTTNGTTTTGTVTWDQTYEGSAMVSVQGVNTCGGGTFSNEFTVDVHTGFVGIGEPSQQRFFTAYPNPVSGTLTITAPKSQKVNIELVNPLGTTVLSKTGQTIDKAYRLDLSGLVPGIYTLTLRGSDVVETLKVIVR
jgi:PKD repeat protein